MGIKYKTGHCLDCTNGKIVPLIAGRCQFHYKIFRHNFNEGKIKARELENGFDSVGDALKMKAWFEDRMKEMTGTCMECGESINKTVYKFAICSIAHILPKRPSMFPSIKFHPDNWLELGATCGCHHRFDNSSWEDLQKWNVWNILVSRYCKFESFIAPEEGYRIPEILLEVSRLRINP